jgi:hypothetical protein
LTYPEVIAMLLTGRWLVIHLKMSELELWSFKGRYRLDECDSDKPSLPDLATPEA